jgi:hypothetical protein
LKVASSEAVTSICRYKVSHVKFSYQVQTLIVHVHPGCAAPRVIRFVRGLVLRSPVLRLSLRKALSLSQLLWPESPTKDTSNCVHEEYRTPLEIEVTTQEKE